MGAVALIVAAALRRGWRGTLLVAVVVALVTGVVLAVAAGARRTATAPDRYVEAVGGDFGALVVQQHGHPRLAEIRALPVVTGVESLTFAGMAIGGRDEPNPFIGTILGAGARLLEGRAADPADPHEFVANRPFVDLYGLSVGDRVPVETYTQAQVDANAFQERPAGPTFDGELVGIASTPDELNEPTPAAVFPLSLLDGDDIGVVTTFMGVRLADGATRDELRAALDTLPGGEELAVDSGALMTPTVLNAVSAQAQGLWVTEAIVAVAGVATLGQVLSRISRISEVDRRRLVALGATRAHTVGAAVGQAAVPAASGLVAGTVVAVLLSMLFPMGFVRELEPHTGIDVDVSLFIGLGVLVLGLLLGWVAAAASIAQRRRPAERPSGLLEALATSTASAPAGSGIRFAYLRNERGAGSVTGAVAGLTAAMVGLMAAAVFGLSLDRFVDDGGRYGNNFDLMLGNGWLPAPTDLRSALERDQDIEGLMLLGAGTARSGEATVELVGVESVRGGLVPRVRFGRAPTTADEVALGRLTAGHLDLRIGDDLVLDGGGASATYRVVGIAVIPNLGVNSGIGQGALLTFDGAHRVAPDTTRSVAGIVLRPGAPPGTAERLSQAAFTPPASGNVPPAIVNVRRIDRVPALLTALLSLLAVVLLVSVLAQAVRSRRRDHAVLRSLGTTGAGVRRIVHWQATALLALPLALGIPLGVVLGRAVFRAFVDRIGAIPDPGSSLALIGAVVLGWLLVANAVAVLPARRTRRTAPAALLHAE